MKLTTEITDKIAGSLKVGKTPRYASKMSGIDKTTYHRWYAKDCEAFGMKCEDPDKELKTTENAYRNFYNKVEDALVDYSDSLPIFEPAITCRYVSISFYPLFAPRRYPLIRTGKILLRSSQVRIATIRVSSIRSLSSLMS